MRLLRHPTRTLFGLVALTAAAFVATPAAALDGIDCSKTVNANLCISADTKIPLRVLTKPQANVYHTADDSGLIAKGDIPAFTVYYVTDMQDVTVDPATLQASGWYEVSTDFSGNATGFLKAEDAVPWRQALAVAYTNPGPSERKPVLMFSTMRDLDAALAEIQSGGTTGEQLHERIAAKDVPSGIVSRENDSWVDIDETFYLLPILDFEDVSAFAAGQDMRSLQVSAITKAVTGGRTTVCTLGSPDYDACQARQSGQGVGGKGFNIDMVFVIDMTRSMNPYIDAVRAAIRDVAKKIDEDSGAGDVRFGIVGYRDNVESSPGLEWVSKNFTPDLLAAEDFRELMESNREIAAAEAGSEDIEEEVFAGMKTAISSAWRDNAARIIVLIGDASAHPATGVKSTTGLDAKSVKDLADLENVSVASIYVGDDENDFEKAKPQFEGMSAGNEGATGFARAASTGGESGLEARLREIVVAFADVVKNRRADSIASDAGDDAVTAALKVAARAAVVDYLGDSAAPPPDLTAWVLDRDIADYEKKAFEVKVLMTKGDVQALIEFLKGLQEQFDNQAVSSGGLFGGLQQGTTAATYDLKLEDGATLDKAGLMPGAIASLPYKSEILTLTLDEFKASSGDARTRFEERLRNLVAYYETALNNTDKWVGLNDDASDDAKVFLIDLAYLP